MLFSPENSPVVQLMDTTDAPLLTATLEAATKSLRLLEAASTRTMFAWGAMACAHSTSRAISTDQLALAAGFFPFPYTLRKQPLLLVQAGRPYCASKKARSASAFGSS